MAKKILIYEVTFLQNALDTNYGLFLVAYLTETSLEPCQTSAIEIFAKITNGF